MSKRDRGLGWQLLRGGPWVLVVALFLVGCSGGKWGEETLTQSPLATGQPAVVSSSTAEPTAVPSLAIEPALLVVLHTNDVWGATEPCG